MDCTLKKKSLCFETCASLTMQALISCPSFKTIPKVRAFSVTNSVSDSVPPSVTTLLNLCQPTNGLQCRPGRTNNDHIHRVSFVILTISKSEPGGLP